MLFTINSLSSSAYVSVLTLDYHCIRIKAMEPNEFMCPCDIINWRWRNVNQFSVILDSICNTIKLRNNSRRVFARRTIPTRFSIRGEEALSIGVCGAHMKDSWSDTMRKSWKLPCVHCTILPNLIPFNHSIQGVFFIHAHIHSISWVGWLEICTIIWAIYIQSCIQYTRYYLNEGNEICIMHALSCLLTRFQERTRNVM